eukprot:5312077-Pyramimonas_sp.AAC.1
MQQREAKGTSLAEPRGGCRGNRPGRAQLPVPLSLAMLCYAALCDAMLCYATLCYAMLCYAALCYAMLGYVMICNVMLLLRCDMLS